MNTEKESQAITVRNLTSSQAQTIEKVKKKHNIHTGSKAILYIIDQFDPQVLKISELTEELNNTKRKLYKREEELKQIKSALSVLGKCIKKSS